MILTKEYAYTSDDQVEVLFREYNIHYRYCVISLIYILYIRVDLCFTVHKLEKFSTNPGKLNFGGLVHLLKYIGDNKKLGLKYYANIDDVPISDLLVQANIKTENQFMVFSDSIW